MRVPIYRQLESNDCGIACIRMISAYYGKVYSIKTLKTLCQQTRAGISISDIVSCFETIGFEASCVNVERKDMYRMPMPAILYLKHGHFVVLEKIRKRHSCNIFTILSNLFEIYYHLYNVYCLISIAYSLLSAVYLAFIKEVLPLTLPSQNTSIAEPPSGFAKFLPSPAFPSLLLLRRGEPRYPQPGQDAEHPCAPHP